MNTHKIRNQIIETIGSSYASDRIIIAQRIIDQQVPLSELMDILKLDHPVSTRFSWLMSDLCDLDNSLSPEILLYSFYNREQINALNFERVIAKQAYLNGMNIPEEIEGEILDWLFVHLANPKTQTSIKYYIKKALKNLIRKYPDLENEFQLFLNN